MTTNNFSHAYNSFIEESDCTDSLSQVRSEGFKRFSRLGYPNRRHEDWKYTSLKDLEAREFCRLKTAHSIDAAKVKSLSSADEMRLVFVNGRFCPELSDTVEQAGLQVQSLAEALKAGTIDAKAWLSSGDQQADAFLALNQAFLNEGLWIKVAANQQAAKPLHILQIADGNQANQAMFLRYFIELEKRAELTIRETAISTDSSAYFVNPVFQIRLGAGAILRHLRLQNEALEASHISAIYTRLGQDAQYEGLQVDLGSRLSHHSVESELAGAQAFLRLDGAYVVGSGQHIDHRTIIDHQVGPTQSSQLYKGVLGGSGRAVFNGLVRIRPGAQLAQAFQLNKNLLLSEQAEVNTRPQMLIDADDVKCSHGATIGQLEQEELFYLRSRGLDAKDAAMFLASGFIHEVLRRHSTFCGSEQLLAIVEERVMALHGD